LEEFNRLIASDLDFDTAQNYLKRMKKVGMQPNVETFNRILVKAQSDGERRRCLEQMRTEGIPPNAKSYTILIKQETNASAIEKAIAEYRKAGRVDDALRLCLDYPHTQAAQGVFVRHPERTLEYFQRIVDEEPNHRNGAYALGYALKQLDRGEEAIPYLEKA